MSWGRELWDQGDNIAAHTKKGIEFLERYASFVGERYKIENEYARQLKTLASKYMPKKRDAEEEQFTHRQAFIGALGELGDLANQHERVAEQFRDEVVAEITQIAKKLKDERKESLDEAMRLQNQLYNIVEIMQKARKEYSRAHKESEAAQAKFLKAESDMNLSRAEVEKAKNNSIAKTQQAEDAKNNYALQLQKTNEFQREYYTKLLPNVFEKLRDMDENRINEMSRLMAKCVDIEKNVLPIVQRCLDGMLEHSRRMDPAADSRAVVQKYKSGYAIPEDYPFEDLSAEGSSTGSGGNDGPNGMTNGGSANHNGNGLGANHFQTPTSPGGGGVAARRTDRRQSGGAGTSIGRSQSRKGGKFSNLFKSKPDEYVKEDFSDLPPQQQCIRLMKRIDEIQKLLDTKLAQKDGLIKMQTVYRESPKLGDLSRVEVELQKCEVELQGLEAEMAKFQNYLKEANTHLNVPINVATSGGSNSTSPSSTPRSSVRGPPPNRPPPPTASPSFQGVPQPQPQTNGRQRNSGSGDGTYIGRSGSDHSVVTGSVGQDSGKGKSRTPTPTHSQAPAINGASAGTPRTSILSYRGNSKPSPSNSSTKLAPAAPVDDYDEWTPTGNGDEYERATANSSPVAILGTCKALYDFSGDGDGMVAMKEGEDMLLLERDAGDGWTKVRKDNMSEGFVPSSYLDCKWYPD